jgi:hypothetical protein
MHAAIVALTTHSLGGLKDAEKDSTTFSRIQPHRRNIKSIAPALLEHGKTSTSHRRFF